MGCGVPEVSIPVLYILLEEAVGHIIIESAFILFSQTAIDSDPREFVNKCKVPHQLGF